MKVEQEGSYAEGSFITKDESYTPTPSFKSEGKRQKCL
jgi:hypothetical protein